MQNAPNGFVLMRDFSHQFRCLLQKHVDNYK